MGVSHTLARGFFWSENILWKEDLGGNKLSVFLAGKDLIVNTKEVAKYLTKGENVNRVEEKGLEWSKHSDVWKGDNGVKVIWCEELDHASIFDSKVRRQMLVDEVLEHSALR